MAKRGKKHQKRHRIVNKEAKAKIVHSLRKSPEELSQSVDGRFRTRTIQSKRRTDPIKGGRRADIERAEREHGLN